MVSSRNLLLRFVTILTLLDVSLGQLPSPCPHVFQYDKRKDQDRWNGTITLETDDELIGVWIHVDVDRPVELFGNSFGEVTTTDNQKFIIRKPNYKLEPDSPVKVDFFVKYSLVKPIPSLTSVRLNGKNICKARRNTPVEESTVYISHKVNKPQQQPTTEASTTSHTRLRVTTASSESSKESFWTEYPVTSISRPRPKPQIIKDESCGTIARRPVGLILRGQSVAQGQWPWHVALYYSEGIQLEYNCGGTLVTRRHVVTAAHCVTRPRSNRPISVDNLLVFMGKYTLNNFGSEVQSSEALEIKVHPEFDSNTYYNDIAIIILGKSVKYTQYVRPICLWSSSTDLSVVVDKVGTVVGWGFDENRQISNNLRQAAMPVVSTDRCIFSNRDLFSQFLFDKNYCAGYRNGTGVCNGDSGGGMVFPRAGTSGVDTVWELRGLVSVSAVDHNEKVCDPQHYMVFTDVAKHLDWIRRIIDDD